MTLTPIQALDALSTAQPYLTSSHPCQGPTPILVQCPYWLLALAGVLALLHYPLHATFTVT